jgi:hypothetical protein
MTIQPFFFASSIRASLNVPIFELAAIGVLTLGIVVMDEHHESRATARTGVFEHLLVAGGVTESTYRTTTDDHVDPFRLACFVVDEQYFGQFDSLRGAFLVILIFPLAHAADDLLELFSGLIRE